MSQPARRESSTYEVWFVRQDGEHDKVLVTNDVKNARAVCNALRVHYHDARRSYIIEGTYHGDKKLV
jgi:hypothetical protein